MNLKALNIDTENIAEAEEKFSAEAKRVEALDFHPRRTGSSPVSRTDNKNKDMRQDWNISGFTFTGKTAIVNGDPIVRLGLQT